MSKSILVVVESPAKAKTIKKYLEKETAAKGQSCQVLATYGHVRDLEPKQGAVDPAHDFAMRYRIIEKNKDKVAAIVDAAKKAEALYLATDPDREGEAIAWDVCELLKEKKVLKNKPVFRIVFYQITQGAVAEAFNQPRQISDELVDAQHARRGLDFLFGFNLSPLLWLKVFRGLSAGRVQSPALRLIVEREEQIRAFVSQEYWTVAAALQKEKQPFQARLVYYENEKIEQFSINNEQQAEAIKQRILQAAKGFMQVVKVEKKQRVRNPAAPFITSTLQQEAIRKLGFTAQRAMRIAQQLYEGIDIGSGSVGLITYMRTDSVNLASEAITEIREVIAERYGKDYVPKEARTYRTKSKNAQEAHEAIRPTAAARHPDLIKSSLTPEQYKLYSLIWKRTVACQMKHAVYDTVTAEIECDKLARFRATGSTLVDPGFIAVYSEGVDEGTPKDDTTEENTLPLLEVGDRVAVQDILPEQHFTEPPPRYTEASLVKSLEELGIGRPSTYATIISTLQNRGYVVLEQKKFHPTDIGEVVNRFLTQYFQHYVDYNFTAKLEDELDDVSRGEKPWLNLLREFWQPFQNQINEIKQTVNRNDVISENLNEACPKCSKELIIRLSKRGRFIGCSGYPDCDYTRNIEKDTSEGNEEQKTAQQAEVLDRNCPDCGSALQMRQGRYGKFIGCTGYPKCKHIESLEKPAETHVNCPQCKQGKMIGRKSRYGKVFYGCNRYPECQYAVWYPPIEEECPKCHWPIMIQKNTKRRGDEKVCPQKECGHAIPIVESQ